MRGRAHPVLQARTAMPLLRLGRLREGFRAYAHRWSVPEYGGDRHATRRPDPATAWHGQCSVAGRRVLVFAEQGFGDTLQFVRYAPLVAAREGVVVLAVPAGLVALCAGLAGVAEVVSLDDPPPATALRCPLLSLPLIFFTTLETIPREVPYLAPPPARREEWRTRLAPDGRLRVGLAWSGNPEHPNDANRSIPFAALAPILAVPGCRFHVLQYFVADADAARLAALPGVADDRAAIRDFADTAAIAGEMDLVISADTAPAHLAGALGRPVWLMLPYAPDWRWLVGREDSPWYPTARLFRQTVPRDWAGVTARVAAALAAFRPG
jgi:hypothetical protein